MPVNVFPLELAQSVCRQTIHSTKCENTCVNDIKNAIKCLPVNNLKMIYNKGVKTNVKTGNTGENIAVSFLERNDYKILQRNWRSRSGEIDIIAVDPDRTLVFVEVKSLKGNINDESKRMGNEIGMKPEDHLDCRKMNKLKLLSADYAARHNFKREG